MVFPIETVRYLERCSPDLSLLGYLVRHVRYADATRTLRGRYADAARTLRGRYADRTLRGHRERRRERERESEGERERERKTHTHTHTHTLTATMNRIRKSQTYHRTQDKEKLVPRTS